MKKTLAAVAVLGAFAGSAFAADVTIYGRLDTALDFADYEATGFNGETLREGTQWGMEQGGSTTSRLGFKGSEEISENLTVGFVLEKKLLTDNGGDAGGDRFFDRESTVWAKTNYGTFYIGYVNSFWSDGGSTNFWAGNYSVFGTGTGGGEIGLGAGTALMVGHSRADNRVAYVSPTFGGFTAYAEYAMGSNSAEENTRESDRPAALGLNFKNGAFGAGLVVSTVFEKDKTEHGEDPEDQFTVNFGTSYDFGVAKMMLAAQYFKDANEVGLFTNNDIWGFTTLNNEGEVVAFEDKFDELEGYGFILGAKVPMAGGTLSVGGSYTQGEDKADLYAKDTEFSGYNVAAQYVYPLSKRTRVYGTVGYTHLEWDYQGAQDKAEYDNYGANVGIAHFF